MPTFQDRWETTELLADHDAVQTWHGKDRQSGDDVAIKVLDVGRVANAAALELFDRQAAVLAELEHPGIPAVRAAFDDEAEGRRCKVLVTDWVSGRSLEQAVRSGATLTERELIQTGLRIAAILEHLHTRVPPIIHRDVKPANVVRAPEGTLSLVDFGSVKLPSSSTGATRGATVTGTWGYMPMEQAEGTATPASDVHALGMTLLFLATHQHPWELSQAPRAAVDAQLHLSAPLRRVLRDFIHPDAAQRVLDGSAARRRLEALLAPPPRMRAPPWVPTVVGAVLAVAAMGAGVFLLRPAPPVRPTFPIVTIPVPPSPPVPPPPSTPPPPREVYVLPPWLGAAERCYARAVPRVLQSHARYRSWVDPAGPTCRERYITYGLYSAYDDAIALCEGAAAAAEGAVAGPLKRVAALVTPGIPLLHRAGRYYDDQRWKDDGCRGARTLHAELVTFLDGMEAGAAQLEDALLIAVVPALRDARARRQSAGDTGAVQALDAILSMVTLAAAAPRRAADPLARDALLGPALALLDQLDRLESARGTAADARARELISQVLSHAGPVRSAVRRLRERGRVSSDDHDPLGLRILPHEVLAGVHLWVEREH